MRSLGRYLLVWLGSAVACVVGLVPTAGLLATMPGEIAFLLAWGLGGLFAAVAAHWLGNRFGPDRGRLLPIVGVTEIAAAVVAIGVIALAHYLGAITGVLAPLIKPLLVSAGIISLCATAATALLRTTEGSPERDRRIGVSLVSGGCLTVVVVVVVTLLVLDYLNGTL